MKQSVGAYGLFNSYNSIGGTKNKFSYFGYFHHRSADGWRNNSDYKWNTGFASVVYKASERLTISAEFTRMQFLLHLSAGLTDSMFNDNPRKSVRERNWFRVNWNIPSVKIGYKISPTSEISVITYMLLSSRKSVENTKTVNIIADTGYRDIRNDHYHNFGTEVRYLKHYSFSKHVTGILSGGIRYYKGRTSREQGLGTNGRDPNFSFLHPTRLEYSDYIFRNNNVALFAENVIKIGKLSVVPGIRFEYIKFIADGYFNSSGTLIYEKGISSSRRFPLFGVGFEYKLRPLIDIYANFTQGYRAANFNDIRITSPNLVIDPDLKDSHGNNFDLGIRGKWKSFLSFDVSVFYLAYNDRIGIVTRKRPDNTTYQISTNIASSRNIGLETFLELELMKAFKLVSKNRVFLYASYSNIDAQYIKSENDFLKNNTVEFVPQNILRTGLTFKSPVFSSTINYSSVSKQYSDANNTVASVTGNNGIVPGYNVIDWSSELTHGNYKLGLSLNNITNNKYFTRRSTSYPGPGLIPAEPVTFLVSLTMKL
jgi:Fe(3+) dicitrate transport protein